jgi:hypothetical protein
MTMTRPDILGVGKIKIERPHTTKDKGAKERVILFLLFFDQSPT